MGIGDLPYSVSWRLWGHLLWEPEYAYLVFGRKRCFAPKTDVCLYIADHTHLANCIRLLDCYIYRYMYNDNTSMFVSRLNPVAQHAFQKLIPYVAYLSITLLEYIIASLYQLDLWNTS